MNREETLAEAKICVCTDRQASYGTPEDSFTAIAKVWSVVLKTEITAAQVCQCMIGLKLVRMTAGNKPDNAVDAAGYAACLNEILDNEIKRTQEKVEKSPTSLVGSIMVNLPKLKPTQKMAPVAMAV